MGSSTSSQSLQFEKRNRPWPPQGHFLFTSSDSEPVDLLQAIEKKRSAVQSAIEKVKPQKDKAKAFSRAIERVARILDWDSGDGALRKWVVEEWIKAHDKDTSLQLHQEVLLRREVEKHTRHKCGITVRPDGSIYDELDSGAIRRYLFESGRVVHEIGDYRPGRAYIAVDCLPDLIGSAYNEVGYDQYRYTDALTLGERDSGKFMEYLSEREDLAKQGEFWKDPRVGIRDVASDLGSRLLTTAMSGSVGVDAIYLRLRYFLDWCDRTGTPIASSLRKSRVLEQEGRPYVDWVYWRSLDSIAVRAAACLVNDVDPRFEESVKDESLRDAVFRARERLEGAIATREIAIIGGNRIEFGKVLVFFAAKGAVLPAYLAQRAKEYACTLGVIGVIAAIGRSQRKNLTVPPENLSTALLSEIERDHLDWVGGFNRKEGRLAKIKDAKDPNEWICNTHPRSDSARKKIFTKLVEIGHLKTKHGRGYWDPLVFDPSH